MSQAQEPAHVAVSAGRIRTPVQQGIGELLQLAVMEGLVLSPVSGYAAHQALYKGKTTCGRAKDKAFHQV